MAYTDLVKKRAYARLHYQRNKARYKERATVHTTKTRVANKAYVAAYLLAHPCLDCGEADAVVLEFDHRDPKQKCFSISTGIRTKGVALATLVVEIAKCDVRCANCHRRRTHLQRGLEKQLSRVVHTHETDGAAPSPATNFLGRLGTGEPNAL